MPFSIFMERQDYTKFSRTAWNLLCTHEDLDPEFVIWSQPLQGWVQVWAVLCSQLPFLKDLHRILLRTAGCGSLNGVILLGGIHGLQLPWPSIFQENPLLS